MCHPDQELLKRFSMYFNIVIVLFLLGSIFSKAPIEVPVSWIIILILVNLKNLWRGLRNERLE